MKIFNRGILIILTILIVVIVIFMFRFISNINNENKYEVTTQLQDKFLVSEKLLRKYPEYAYDIEIFDYTSVRKKLILKLHNEEDIHRNKISYLYTDNDIKAYSYSNYIIYKEKSSENFKSVEIGEFKDLDPKKYSYLVPVAKKITHSNWGFAQLVSEFLIKSNDSDAINEIKRYAKGKFTSEEIENNEYSGFSKSQMENYFSILLTKYNIK